jgi:hypothetical protein
LRPATISGSIFCFPEDFDLKKEKPIALFFPYKKTCHPLRAQPFYF